jgi:hypothetical protein
MSFLRKSAISMMYYIPMSAKNLYPQENVSSLASRNFTLSNNLLKCDGYELKKKSGFEISFLEVNSYFN